MPLLAGVQGFEPQLADPESAVLPLNDTPMYFCRTRMCAFCEMYDILTYALCQALFWHASSQDQEATLMMIACGCSRSSGTFSPSAMSDST